MTEKQFSRREFLRVTGAGASAALLAACQPPPVKVEKVDEVVVTAPPMEPVTIGVMTWFNHPFKDLLPQFKDSNPDIDVEFIDSGDGYSAKVATALASGSELADIAGAQDNQIKLWADTGGMADISEYMAPYEDKIVPYKLANSTYQGKTYGIPWDGSPCLLYYRRDVCEQYNIDPEAIETYDDWLAVGQQLVGQSDNKHRLTGLEKTNYFPSLNWIRQQGGGLYDLEGMKVIIDAPEAVETLEFLKTLWDSDTIFQNMDMWGTQQASYKDGSSAIFPQAIWMANSIKGNAPETAGKWGVAPLPAWVRGDSGTYTYGGSQLMIPITSKHKEEAFKFCEYSCLTQAGSEVLWTSGDLFPVLKDAENWEIINEQSDWYGGQAALRMFAEANGKVTSYNFGIGWAEGRDIYTQAVGEVLNGDKTPEQALADAAKEIRDRQDLG